MIDAAPFHSTASPTTEALADHSPSDLISLLPGYGLDNVRNGDCGGESAALLFAAADAPAAAVYQPSNAASSPMVNICYLNTATNAAGMRANADRLRGSVIKFR